MWKTYARALALLKPEARLAGALTAANLALGAVALIEPILFGRLIDSLGRDGEQAGLYVAAWAGFGVLSVVAGVFTALMADRLAHRRRLATMRLAFDRAITLPISRVSQQGTGKLTRVILSGGEAVFWLVLPFMRDQLPALFALALMIPVAFWMNPLLASVLLALAAAYAAANAYVVRRTEVGQREVERLHQDVSGRIADVVSNVSVVQAFANLGHEARQLEGVARDFLKAQYPVLSWWALLTVLTRAGSTLAMVTIFAIGAVLARSGEITVGEIVSFSGFAGLLIGKLDVLAGTVARLFMGAPTLQAFFDLMDERAGSRDDPDAAPLTACRGEIAFEGVTHWIAENDDVGVFDVTFRAPAGATVALVGASGAGKTTLMALLQRLRDPDLGRITVDGRDLRKVTLDSLRANVAVVFQDAGLFNRSVADNLRLARPEATDAELERALRLAQAWDFVRQKEGGLDFVIGERGQLLSGGERQRLAIARAILKDAPILILDEATSALDTVTEAKVKAALDAARTGRTTFLVAHRLSTVAGADLILVVDKGRIVQRGGWDDLLAVEGPFRRLAEQAGLANPRRTAETPALDAALAQN